MRILLIGGTGFIGPFVAAELDRLGHQLAVFHRGTSNAPLSPPRIRTTTVRRKAATTFSPDTTHSTVRHIAGDRRRLGESAGELLAFAPEIVVDLILSSGTQARQLMELFSGVARRVVAA